MPTLQSHTHCQAAPADPQAKTWQRVCLSQPTIDRQSGRKKNTERTTFTHLVENSTKRNHLMSFVYKAFLCS
jgi:hypothetical protein